MNFDYYQQGLLAWPLALGYSFEGNSTKEPLVALYTNEYPLAGCMSWRSCIIRGTSKSLSWHTFRIQSCLKLGHQEHCPCTSRIFWPAEVQFQRSAASPWCKLLATRLEIAKALIWRYERVENVHLTSTTKSRDKENEESRAWGRGKANELQWSLIIRGKRVIKWGWFMIGFDFTSLACLQQQANDAKTGKWDSP
jgi:hypothetical protein